MYIYIYIERERDVYNNNNNSDDKYAREPQHVSHEVGPLLDPRLPDLTSGSHIIMHIYIYIYIYRERERCIQ